MANNANNELTFLQIVNSDESIAHNYLEITNDGRFGKIAGTEPES